MSEKKNNLSDSDLFRQAIGNVKRMQHDHAPPTHKKPDSNPRQSQHDEEQVLQDMMSTTFVDAELQPGDVLEYSNPGLQKKVIRRLRRGEYRRDAELDLHGLTTRAAKTHLSQFLHLAQQHQWRCIKIIHGKGYRSDERGPVLKSLINSWLQHRKEVLAFCSAPPNDGGTGVVYVLLKQLRNAL